MKALFVTTCLIPFISGVKENQAKVSPQIHSYFQLQACSHKLRLNIRTMENEEHFPSLLQYLNASNQEDGRI